MTPSLAVPILPREHELIARVRARDDRGICKRHLDRNVRIGRLQQLVACEVQEYREERSPIYIRAVIYVERESQKRILIGARGERIREIGRASRAKIEELVGAAVYLDLWVKVLSNWRKNADALRRLGYRLPKEHAQ